MATQIQLRGGTTSEHSTFTGAVREVTVDTDKDTVVVHDGGTAGGIPLAKEASVLPLAGGTMTGTIAGFTSTGIDDNATSTAITINASEQVSVGTAHTPTSANASLGIYSANDAQLEVKASGAWLKTYSTNAAGQGYGGWLHYDNTDTFAAGVYVAGTDNALGFTNNGSERMRIDSSGNVGIGTSSPEDKLSLDQPYAASGEMAISFNQSNFANRAAKIIHKMDASGNGGSLLFATNANGADASERMRIDSSGNVGIGGTTTTGWANKQLVLDAGADASAAFVLVNDTTGRTATDGSLITLSGSDMYLIQRESANMIFRTANTERMRIDSSGNVGIGTTSPSAKLDVAGTLKAGATGYQIKTSASAGNNSAIIHRSENAGHLELRADDADYNQLFLKNGGLVGIGTSSPSEKLDVNGSVTCDNKAIITGTDTGNPVNAVVDSMRVSGYGIQANRGAMFLTNAATDGKIHMGNNGAHNDNILASFTTNGLTFNGDTAAANALDDYETGTLTSVTMTPSTSGTITVMSGYNTLVYTKVGNLVTVSGQLAITTTSSPVGTLVAIPLPFTSGSSRSAGGFYHYTGSGNETVKPYDVIGGANELRVHLDASTVTSSHEFWVGITYTAA